jgi:N utilization substance protein B
MTAPRSNPRSQARSTARLAAVQALYQQQMEGTPLARLLDEFHQHRLGREVDDEDHIGEVYAYELLARADVPAASAINEYVDVAKAFFDDREAKFVNGILDAIGKDLRV